MVSRGLPQAEFISLYPRSRRSTTIVRPAVLHRDWSADPHPFAYSRIAFEYQRWPDDLCRKNDSIPLALDEVHLELSKQYYLGYYASRKSGFHRIRVDVPGRDVKIRAKIGYFGG